MFIVIPMHPEGIPTDAAIQEMLFWQRRTMEMMYTRIAQVGRSRSVGRKKYRVSKTITYFFFAKLYGFFLLGNPVQECIPQQ